MPTPSIETPTVVELKVEKFSEIVINDCKEYTFYINGQEYKRLPLDANVREPNISKSKPYKDMCDTLRESPEKFFENNLGISVVATNVEQLTKNKFRITFTNGTGILNGGHTQQAILDSREYPQIYNAIIKVTVRKKNYELSRIAEIAAAQNSSTAVKEYSLAEKKGLFQPLKTAMPNKEKHIVWYEGRKVPNDNGMNPDDLIALINVFNIDLYNSRYNISVKNQPTRSAGSKGSVFKTWENETQTYYKLYPLVEDMIDLGEYIKLNFYEGGTNMTSLKVIDESKSKKIKPLVFSNEVCKYELPTQFYYPLIASFRSNVYYNAEHNEIGWFRNNIDLFDECKKSLCGKLRSFYTTSYSNNIQKCGKDPNLFEALYSVTEEYIHDFSSPEKIYIIPQMENNE